MNNVIAFIAGITPTNYGVSYIVKNSKLRRRIRASLPTAIYGNKTSGLFIIQVAEVDLALTETVVYL